MNNHLLKKIILLSCFCILFSSCKKSEIDDIVIPPTPKPSSFELTNLTATVTPTSTDPKDPDRDVTLTYTYSYFYDYKNMCLGDVWVDWGFLDSGLNHKKFIELYNTNGKIVTETKNDLKAGSSSRELGKTFNIRLQIRAGFFDQTIISEKMIAVTFK